MSAIDIATGSSKQHSSPSKLKAKRPTKRLQELRRSGGDTISSYNYRRPANGVRPDSVDVDSVYEDDTTDLMTRFTNNVRRHSHKNSHRPRGRYGRGLPKKNGAGGNFTWGLVGSEFAGQPHDDGSDPAIDNTDPLDPNYDSDSEDNCKLEAITPPMEEHEIENYVKPIIIEYFEHGDSDEVALLLEDVNLANNYHQILVITITLAMERKSSYREMASN
ncbi:Programmed cell death protein 4, partial [Fragariocoptes setiger]